MIKLEHAVLVDPEQMEFIIEGIHNLTNSSNKSDSDICRRGTIDCSYGCAYRNIPSKCPANIDDKDQFIIGPNDYILMQRLSNAGTDNRKFMRMISVYVRITAPLYWWKEFDNAFAKDVVTIPYTLDHSIQEKEFTLEDFSTEHLFADDDIKGMYYSKTAEEEFTSTDTLNVVIEALNNYRRECIITKDKKYWWQMIQLLPSSYNQTRNIILNYEVLADIYRSKRSHKLDEWLEFCKWIESLPYSELICKNEYRSLMK